MLHLQNSFFLLIYTHSIRPPHKAHIGQQAATVTRMPPRRSIPYTMASHWNPTSTGRAARLIRMVAQLGLPVMIARERSRLIEQVAGIPSTLALCRREELGETRREYGFIYT